MAVDRRIWPAGEALLDLVYSLILGIPVAYRKLGPLLEIDDDGHRHPGSARPARVGRRARVAEQIASSGPCMCAVAPGYGNVPAPTSTRNRAPRVPGQAGPPRSSSRCG